LKKEKIGSYKTFQKADDIQYIVFIILYKKTNKIDDEKEKIWYNI
jgi:hypothetical protein